MTAFAGTATLIRFILRRDRIRIPIWIFSITGFFMLVASSFPSIYPTEAERQSRATLMENPTAIAFRGPGHGFDDYTYGAMLSHELMGYAAIAVALMSIFLVVRHTRTEEEHGRLELIRSSVTGRYASPVAALTVAFGANLAVAGLFATLLPLIHEEYAFAGSLAFGLSVGSVGILFAGLAALMAQLSEYGRGASNMALIALGVFYLIRAIGDVQQNWISWLSPVGWAQATRPFVDERWWPLLLPVASLVIILPVVFTLLNRRDVAAGILPQRPGPANATEFISRPFGFAFQQQRGAIIGWAIALIVLGIAFGSLVGEVETFVDDNPQLEDFLAAAEGGTLVDAFISLLVMVMSFLAAGFAVQSALRPRTEETEGRAEPMLSTAISRQRWLGSYLLVSLLGSAAILLAGAGTLGAMAAIDQNDTNLLFETLGAGIAYLPAVWAIAGLAATLFGILPRVLAIAWLMVIYGVFIGLFGDMLEVPGWATTLSPFEYVPSLPGGDLSILPVVVLTGLAAALLLLGLAGIRNRDLEMN